MSATVPIFSLPERRKVNRILFVSAERAREALPQLQAGMDFEQYKEQHPAEKIKVDTVWLQTTENPNEFESAVLTLDVGETSDIITTQSGSYVARILDNISCKNADACRSRGTPACTAPGQQ